MTMNGKRDDFNLDDFQARVADRSIEIQNQSCTLKFHYVDFDLTPDLPVRNHVMLVC